MYIRKVGGSRPFSVWIDKWQGKIYYIREYEINR